jgi:hypothetical protein
MRTERHVFPMHTHTHTHTHTRVWRVCVEGVWRVCGGMRERGCGVGCVRHVCKEGGGH